MMQNTDYEEVLNFKIVREYLGLEGKISQVNFAVAILPSKIYEIGRSTWTDGGNCSKFFSDSKCNTRPTYRKQVFKKLTDGEVKVSDFYEKSQTFIYKEKIQQHKLYILIELVINNIGSYCPNFKSYLEDKDIPFFEKLAWLVIYLFGKSQIEEVFLNNISNNSAIDMNNIIINLKNTIYIKYIDELGKKGDVSLEYRILFMAIYKHVKKNKKFEKHEIERGIRKAIYFHEKLTSHVEIVNEYYNSAIIEFFIKNNLLMFDNNSIRYSVTNIGENIFKMMQSEYTNIE